MIWRNLKNRVIDFFFKEVEIEEEPEMKEAYGSLYSTEQYRLSSLERKPSDVKVRYQYARKTSAPFRFPVIPDEEKSIQKPTGIRDRHQNYPKPVSKSTALAGKKEALPRNLEDVPAFMRRNDNQEVKQSVSLQHKSVNRKVETDEQETDIAPKEILPHTKPAELDAVFKKRDGKLEQNEAPIEEVATESEPEAMSNKDHLETEEVDPALREPVKTEDTILPRPSVVEHDAPTMEDTSNSGEKKSFKPADTMPKHKHAIQQKDNHLKPDVPDYLLNDHGDEPTTDDDWLIEQQILLEDTFTHFNIEATVVNVTQGPSVTRFEIQPALGVKVSKIKNLSDDIKLNLAAKDIRMEAPIPGKNTIGIEIPNETMHLVNLQDLFETERFKHASSPLTVALGLTIEGTPIITTINKMPHGLIAGATGSGKSVCINTIILSLLYKAHHTDVKLLLIDPKMVELTPYNHIPHLIAPVITDVKAATKALKWAVDEMEDRYRQFVDLGVRNIEKYNEKVTHTDAEKMSYIVIIIDELADLMMMAPQEVEDAICRIAQKARACGIHLLLATQRPSVDVITGLIKANIPTRIAFSVSSQVDSRTMIDTNGAEKLLGKGDMLFVENGAGKAARLQGPFVSDEEIERVASYVRSIAEPDYLFEEEQLLTYSEDEGADELLHEVVTFVVHHNQASTSLLQRQFRIGYNRAARLIDSLEEKGIISGQNGSKPREVLINEEQIDNI